MRCRAVVCDACCTRLDGVNHCHACLRAMAARAEARPSGAGWRLVGAGLLLLAGWLPLFLLLLLLQGWLAP
jgi:hypothetical protein